MAEGVVHRHEVPGLVAQLGQRRCRTGGLRVGIEHPVETVGGAFGRGQCAGGRAAVHGDAALFLDQLLHRQRHRGIGEIGDGLDLVAVQPFAGAGHANVGLVLVVGREDLDLHAFAFILEAVFHRHFGGHHRTLAAHGRVGAGHVGEHPDLDRVGILGKGGHGRHGRGGQRHRAGHGRSREGTAESVLGHLVSLIL